MDALQRFAPKTGRSGALAKFHDLSRSERGYAHLRDAGVSATAVTQRKWLADMTEPSAKNQAAISRAYADWRADNMATKARRELGRTVTVYPDQRGVQRGHLPASPVKVVISDADMKALADATLRGDEDAAARAWRSVVDRNLQGSPPGAAYATVSHVVFAG